MKNYFSIGLFILFLVTSPFLLAQDILSEESQEKIIVDIEIFEPDVMMRPDGKPYGFEIEILEAIAEKLDLDIEYREVAQFSDIFSDLREHRADIGIAGITINEQREASGIDFSHRVLGSGLHIMVPANISSGIFTLLGSIFNMDTIKILLVLVVYCIFMGFLFWLVERNHIDDIDKGWRGIFDGFYWGIVTSSTVGYGDYTSKSRKGKFLSIITILTGLALFGAYIGAVGSNIIYERLESDISGPSDLRGKIVATVKDTTSVETLRNLNAEVVSVEKISQTYDLLLKGEVQAIVFDAPPLLYYANNEGRGKAVVVGPLFEKQDYGFAFPEGSPLREEINRVLLHLQENGLYDNLHKKYFGD